MAARMEATDIKRTARAICGSRGIDPDGFDTTGLPAWKAWIAAATAARETLLSTDCGERLLTLERGDAERICARLEFDASWDKVGSGYYLLKQQLRAS